MFDNQISVVGNLVADPRMSFTKDGAPVASFRIASTPRRFDRATGQWHDGDTLYVNVTCWRGLAENVNLSLRKGQSAVVIGKLSVRPYETKEGEKRQSVDIDAVAVGPDLMRAVAVVKRAERGVADGPAAGAAPAAAAELATTLAAHDDFGVADHSILDEIDDETDEFDDDIDDETDDMTDGGAGAGGDGSGDAQLVGAGASANGGRLKARFGLG